MKVAIIGRTHWLRDSALKLIEAGHEITSVITAPASPEYRATTEDFQNLATLSGGSFLADGTGNSDELAEILKASAPDIAISMNWPQILSEKVCNIPEHGILNSHPGDLPRYRGNACPNWAILADEPKIGLCIHAMDPGELDSGPIYIRETIKNSDTLYINDVYQWLDNVIPQSFLKALKLIADQNFQPTSQTDGDTRPLRCHPRRQEDGAIDWTRSADEIHRLIRASSRPFAGAYATLETGERLTIWRAKIAKLDHDIHAMPGQVMGRSKDGSVQVACGSGVLEIEEGEQKNGQRLSARNKYRLRPGKEYTS